MIVLSLIWLWGWIKRSVQVELCLSSSKNKKRKMKPKDNVLMWGLEHVDGDTTPRSMKFVFEMEHSLFSIDQCPIFEAERSLAPSPELVMGFGYNNVPLSDDTVVMPVPEGEGEYCITTTNTQVDTSTGLKKPDFVVRVEDDKINVYLVEQQVVDISDLVIVLQLHKCCEDFIRLNTQKDKDIAQKPLDDLLEELKIPVSDLYKRFEAAMEQGQRYEELVLNVCTDEFGMTLNQALKTLALMLASMQKLFEENVRSASHAEITVPYHG